MAKNNDDLRLVEKMASNISIYPLSEIVAGYKTMQSGEYIGIIGLLHSDKLIGSFWYEKDAEFLSARTLTAYISKKYIKH